MSGSEEFVCAQVGGVEEYRIADAVQSGRITKPIVAWCTGTCVRCFRSEVQFGHAGACANAERETAESKNSRMRSVGIHVPDSFDTFGELIRYLPMFPLFILLNSYKFSSILLNIYKFSSKSPIIVFKINGFVQKYLTSFLEMDSSDLQASFIRLHDISSQRH